MMLSNAPKISLRGVSVIYHVVDSLNKPKQIRALDNIDLDIESGDKVGLIGLNGSGKSTLLRVMGGSLYPSKGSVRETGDKLVILNRTSGLLESATLAENAKLKAFSFNLDRASAQKFVNKAVIESGFEERASTMLSSLSAGMAGRFNLALNTQVIRDINILDEWVSALEVGKRSDESLFSRLINEAKIVVFASHNNALITGLCNRIIVLEQGQIIYDGPNHSRAFWVLSLLKKVNSSGKYTPARMRLFIYRVRRHLLLKKRRRISNLRSMNRLDGISALAGISREKITGIRNIRSELPSRAIGLNEEVAATGHLQSLHVINIGRTSIPAIKGYLDGVKVGGYRPVFHGLRVRLADVLKGSKVLLIYRDPIERFVSGFYSRLHEGKPNFDSPWNAEERAVFQVFTTPSELLEALASASDRSRLHSALKALREVEFINRGLTWYFDSPQSLERRLNDFVAVLNVADSQALGLSFQNIFSLNKTPVIVDSDEQFIGSMSEALSPLALNVFGDIFSTELEIYAKLEALSQQGAHR